MLKRFEIPKLLTLGLALSANLLACTYFPPSYDVGPQFSVKLKSGKRTFAGIRVVLEEIGGEPNYTSIVRYAALTNETGVAEFRTIKAGKYWVAIDSPGSAGWDTAEIKVTDVPEAKQIELRWPSEQILEMARVSGRLIDSRTGKAPELSLTLVDAHKGRRFSSLVLDKSGKFDLGVPRSGLYFLKLEPLRRSDWEPDGVIPIMINGSGRENFLLAISQTSCGLKFSEACTFGQRTVLRLRGNLTDTMGAVIWKATVELTPLAPNSSAPLHTTPDRTGDFSFPNLSPGDYLLKVQSSGFAPVEVPVKIDPSSRQSDLTIKMGAVGFASCEELTK